MTITVAGNKKEVAEGLTVAQLIIDEDVETPEYVTVSVNDEFLASGTFEETVLKDGDVVEFLYPHVVGGSVGLPSIWVLAAVTIGGNLMGIVGMLIFIPLVSVLYTIFREFVYLRLKEKNIKQVTKTVVEEYTAEEIAAMEKNIKTCL